MRYSEIFTPTIHYTELDKDIKLANRFNEIRKSKFFKVILHNEQNFNI